MDPVTIAGLITGSIFNLVDVILALRKVAETIKDARKDIGQLLQQSERMRNILELLRITLHELDKTRFKDLQLSLNRTKFE